jgi:outer membrane protein assembly factor BamA
MKKNILRFTFLVVVALVLSSVAEASIFPDRRKDQFATDFGYALFPYPYSLPGIGTGLGLVGGASNIAGTHTDAYGMAFGGDITGLALGVADLHILPKTLILDTGLGNISSATIQSYSSRGMSTNKNDYSNIEMSDMTYYGSRMTATFLERRFELYGAYYQGSSQLKSIRDKDGNLIVETQSSTSRGHVTLMGTRVDLTDDYADPRRGMRLDVGRSLTPPQDSGPDYYIQDISATGYVPLGRRSTWAFNYFRSDAHVNRQGETDPTVVATKYNCTSLPLGSVERTFCDNVVKNEVLNNTYGTASSLGGFSRLRSYSNSRYKGAHTRFYGTEIRWNLTDESTPYDIFIMKDIRTAWQVALYYEIGSTADIRSQVGDTWRSSTGIGLRMVTASGVVFRADVATGTEGVSPSIFIGYPWEL